jgi:hypothetical protein
VCFDNWKDRITGEIAMEQTQVEESPVVTAMESTTNGEDTTSTTNVSSADLDATENSEDSTALLSQVLL